MILTDVILALLLPVLLAASAFCSGCETALFSLSVHQRALFARQKTMVAQAVTTLLAETRSLLITLLLSNMTVNTTYFVVNTVLLLRVQKRLELGPLVITSASIISLLILILLGEVLPKVVAARGSGFWIRHMTIPLLVIYRGIAPVRLFASAAVITPLSRLIAPSGPTAELSTEELGSLLELSQQHGVIDRGEEQLLQQVLELNQLRVRDLMVPRVDMRAFDLDSPPDQLIALVRATGLSHLPAYRGDIDRIEGVIYSREVLLGEPATPAAVAALLRPAKFVPEQQRVDQLLVDLRKTGTTFAIVVDEYGGTAGLITLEVVVEHMVGDIAGPYEGVSENPVETLAPGLWRVSADLSIHDWADAFNQARLGAQVSTIGGLVMARLGRLPRVGDRTTVGNVVIEVRKMAGRRIDSLLIRSQVRPTDAAALAQRPTPPAPPTGGPAR
jgi:CBS domain containing-hemolysin-like protein